MGFDYKPPRSQTKEHKVSDLFIKRKISHEPLHVLRKRNMTRLDEGSHQTHTNRFFDTFTKFQQINETMEVPSPSFIKPKLNLSAAKQDKKYTT